MATRAIFFQLSSVFKELPCFEIELLDVKVDANGYFMADKVRNLYKSKGAVLLRE